MIVLLQSFDDKTEKWTDLQIPKRTLGVPVRGKQPLVETVEQFADELKRQGLVGGYRAYLQNGELWLIRIIRRDAFEAEIRQELPRDV